MIKFVLLLFIILLLFSTGDLPGIGTSLGRGINKTRRISSQDYGRKMKSGFNIIKALMRAISRLYYVILNRK